MQWDVLFHAVFEYFHLLRAHRKHSIESEAISFWASGCSSQLHSAKIIIKRYYDLSALPLLDRIRRSESSLLLK